MGYRRMKPSDIVKTNVRFEDDKTELLWNRFKYKDCVVAYLHIRNDSCRTSYIICEKGNIKYIGFRRDYRRGDGEWIDRVYIISDILETWNMIQRRKEFEWTLRYFEDKELMEDFKKYLFINRI